MERLNLNLNQIAAHYNTVNIPSDSCESSGDSESASSAESMFKLL